MLPGPTCGQVPQASPARGAPFGLAGILSAQPSRSWARRKGRKRLYSHFFTPGEEAGVGQAGFQERPVLTLAMRTNGGDRIHMGALALFL